jgi:hypothetical protein
MAVTCLGVVQRVGGKARSPILAYQFVQVIAILPHALQQRLVQQGCDLFQAGSRYFLSSLSSKTASENRKPREDLFLPF